MVVDDPSREIIVGEVDLHRDPDPWTFPVVLRDQAPAVSAVGRDQATEGVAQGRT